MGFKLNPLTGLFDISGAAGAISSWKTSVDTEANLPTLGNTDADVRVTRDTDFIWVWDATTSRWISSGLKAASFGAVPNANGYSITSTNVGANRTELRLTLQPADATNPGALSVSSQEIAGEKHFLDTLYAEGGLDVTGSPGVDTLAIGATNADIVNIGRSGATVNIIGTTNVINVTNLEVADKNILINDGGSAGSASSSGLSVEEGGSVTGYAQTNATRDAWTFKAPASSGEIELKPDNTAFKATIDTDTLTANRTHSLPDASGTLGLVPAAGVVKSDGTSLSSGDVDLTSEVTNRLPLGNLAYGSANQLLATNGAGTDNAFKTLQLGTAGTDLGLTHTDSSITLDVPNASATARGVVSTGAQTFAGVKTLNSPVLNNADLSLDDTGSAFSLNLDSASGLTADRTLTLDLNDADRTIDLNGNLTVSSAASVSGTNTGDVSLTAVGAVPNANGASLSGQALTLQPANGTNPGLLTASTQTVGGVKTFLSSPVLDSLTASLPLQLNGSKEIVSQAIDLTTSQATGTLPVSKGGTNSATALNNNRIMVSSGSAIVEASALTNGQLLVGSTGAAPVAASLTAGTGITITNGAGSISVTNSAVASTDIPPTAISGSGTGTGATDYFNTALTLDPTVTSFEALVDIKITQGALLINSPVTYKVVARRIGSNWTTYKITTEVLSGLSGDTSKYNIAVSIGGVIQVVTTGVTGAMSFSGFMRAITLAN